MHPSTAPSVEHNPSSNMELETGRWGILAILLWLVGLSAMTQFVMAPLSLLIMDDLGIGKGEFGVLSSAFTFGTVTTTFAAGMLINRIGARRIYLIGPVAMGILLLSFFIPQTYFTAFALLTLTGVAYSAVIPTTNASVLHWFPQTERGLAMGVKQAGMPLGLTLLAAIVPQLTLHVGWQTILAGLGILVLVSGVVSHAFYREGPFAASPSPSVKAPKGGSNRLSEAGTSSSPWQLLRSSSMIWLCLLGFAFSVIQVAIVTFLVPYLHEGFGISVVAYSRPFMPRTKPPQRLPTTCWKRSRTRGGLWWGSCYYMSCGQKTISALSRWPTIFKAR